MPVVPYATSAPSRKRVAGKKAWKLGDRVRTETNLRDWLGARGQTGHMAPAGFPRTPEFGS